MSLKSNELTDSDLFPQKRNQIGAFSHAKVRAYHATITLDAAAVDAVAEMVRLPEGFAVIGGYIHAAALGSGVTLALGSSATADKYIGATAANTANKLINIDKALCEYLAADESVYIKVAGAAATGKVKVVIYGVSKYD